MGWWRSHGIAVRAGGCLHAIDAERLTNGHIGSRDHSSFCHQHSSIIAYRIEFAQPESFKRNQRLHALITREYQDFNRVQRDTIGGQELLQMLEDDLRKVMNLLVNGFKWSYLYQLVDGLLNDRACIRIDFLNRQRM